MRIIKTTTGVPITLDGDLLAIMEALYHEVTARRELERSFEDMVKEIQHLIEQMDDGERRTYLAESLFLNTVKYENDKLDAYMRKLSQEVRDRHVPELPRHSFPVHVALEHGRAALRRTHCLRLRRPLRPSSARRSADARRCTRCGRDRRSRRCGRT